MINLIVIIYVGMIAVKIVITCNYSHKGNDIYYYNRKIDLLLTKETV